MRDWASARRARWSRSRVVAAIGLHLLILTSLKLAVDHVTVPRRAADRATTLLDVVLHDAPPPPSHALPLPLPPPRPARPQPPARAPRPRDVEPQAITLPAPVEPAIAAAAPPVSAPQPDLRFLDGAATRQALRDAGRATTLASRASALTHEEQGSELLAADGSHCNCKRDLAVPREQVLAQGVASAHKADCMKDFSGAVLLAAPIILAAEAMGKCAHKL